MRNVTKRLRPLWLLVVSLVLFSVVYAADEYVGQFDSALEPNRDNLDKVVFQPVNGSLNFKLPSGLDSDANVTASFLYNPNNEKLEIPALLIEPNGGAPFLWVDANLNKAFEADEKFTLQREEENNPYQWNSIIKIPLQKGAFKTFPLFVQFFREVKWDDMGDDDRLVLQSSEVYARGFVDIVGKKTLVAYSYNPRERRITLNRSKFAVDCDGDGNLDWGRFSGEAAQADDDTVVFRVGEIYVSNKRADVEKNSIILKSHAASDYKRIELKVGDVFPDFDFKDFQGKKRSFREFRGKYVLLDFWAIWCGPCRREMPYHRAALQRYGARGFEVLGLNADYPDYVPSAKKFLNDNRLDWTQATRESINPLMQALRIHLFPSTLLVDPEGKIISLDERKKDQLELRGQDLLKSLQSVFFPAAASTRPATRPTTGNNNNQPVAANGKGGSVNFGNIRLTEPPAGFTWKPVEKFKMFCLVPDGWAFKEEATAEGVRVTITEPQDEGDIVIVSEVKTKVAGSAVEVAAATMQKLVGDKKVLNQNQQQNGDYAQATYIVQEGRELTFYVSVANAKTNSLRLSNMIIPFPRMNEVGQKAQTAMNTILMFER